MTADQTSESIPVPTRNQGCVLAAGGLVLAFGGCVTAGFFDSEALLMVSTIGALVAGIAGVVALIARIVGAFKRR
jgi:hypothetical protein